MLATNVNFPTSLMIFKNDVRWVRPIAGKISAQTSLFDSLSSKFAW